jgi:hypothetical protein
MMKIRSYKYDMSTLTITVATQCHGHEVPVILSDFQHMLDPEKVGVEERVFLEEVSEKQKRRELAKTATIVVNRGAAIKAEAGVAVEEVNLAKVDPDLDSPPKPRMYDGHVVVAERKSGKGQDVLVLYSGEEVLLDGSGAAVKRRKLEIPVANDYNYKHACRWKAGMRWGGALIESATVISERRVDLKLEDGRLLTVGPDDSFKVHEATPEPDVQPTEKPAEPTEKPAEPTEKPAEPTEKPAEPTEKPAEPTEKPAEPSAVDVGDDTLAGRLHGAKTVQDVVRGVVEDGSVENDFASILAWCKGNKGSIPRLSKLTEAKFDSAVKRAYTMVSA